MEFKNFLNVYSKESDLVKKLTLIYDFIDNTIYKEDMVILLMEHFNDVKFHLSEIKTILIISKPLIDNELRKKLIETYNKKKNV